MDDLSFDLGEMFKEIEKLCKRIDEASLKAKEKKIREAIQRRSDQICREYGIAPKKGVTYHIAEFGGGLRIRKG